MAFQPKNAVCSALWLSEPTSRVLVLLKPFRSLILLLIVALVVSVILGGTVNAQQGSTEADRLALIAFYHSTDGPNWTNNNNWLSSRPIGQWYGVTTNAMGRVTNLNLSRNGLSGQIPREVGNLSNLQELSLYRNYQDDTSPGLSGRIPAELSNLVNLTKLNLYFNNFSGSIPPEIGKLSANLQVLNLGYNQLTGQIPPELGDLTKLTLLSLRPNRLSGQIPQELGNLKNLHYLYLGSGVNPGETQSYPNVNNKFIGCIPHRLSNVAESDLGTLNLPVCPVELPLGDVSDLRARAGSNPGEVILSWSPGANAEGHVVWSQVAGGKWVRLDRTIGGDATGVRVSGLESGQRYRFAVRAVRGADRSTWIYTTLVPTCKESPEVERLVLVNFYAATSKGGLNDNGNWVYDGKTWNERNRWDVQNPDSHHSQWPGVTVKWGCVTELDLSGFGLDNNERSRLNDDKNDLNILGALTGLTKLDLSYNDLGGTLPTGLGELTNLTYLDLSGNSFYGDIGQVEWKQLKNLEYLDLSWNKTCTNAEGCDNGVSGSIPAELGNLHNLKVLDLAYNDLSGAVPTSLANLFDTLAELDLSHNKLQAGMKELMEAEAPEHPHRDLYGDALRSFHVQHIQVNVSNNKWEGDDKDYWEEFQGRITRGIVDLALLITNKKYPITGVDSTDTLKNYIAKKGVQKIRARAVAHVATRNASQKFVVSLFLRGSKAFLGVDKVLGWTVFAFEAGKIVLDVIEAGLDYFEQTAGGLRKAVFMQYIGGDDWLDYLECVERHGSSKCVPP